MSFSSKEWNQASETQTKAVVTSHVMLSVGKTRAQFWLFAITREIKNMFLW